MRPTCQTAKHVHCGSRGKSDFCAQRADLASGHCHCHSIAFQAITWLSFDGPESKSMQSQPHLCFHFILLHNHKTQHQHARNTTEDVADENAFDNMTKTATTMKTTTATSKTMTRATPSALQPALQRSSPPHQCPSQQQRARQRSVLFWSMCCRYMSSPSQVRS